MPDNKSQPRGIRFPEKIRLEIQSYADEIGISFASCVLVLCREALDSKARTTLQVQRDPDAIQAREEQVLAELGEQNIRKVDGR